MGAQEVVFPKGLDESAGLAFETIMGDTELRLGLLDGEYRSWKNNQIDTMMSLLGDNARAVELVTSGGKTVVLTAMLRVDVEVFGRERGIYVARKGQADAFLQQLQRKRTG
jgi:hypothetical protein